MIDPDTEPFAWLAQQYGTYFMGAAAEEAVRDFPEDADGTPWEDTAAREAVDLFRPMLDEILAAAATGATTTEDTTLAGILRRFIADHETYVEVTSAEPRQAVGGRVVLMGPLYDLTEAERVLLLKVAGYAS